MSQNPFSLTSRRRFLLGATVSFAVGLVACSSTPAASPTAVSTSAAAPKAASTTAASTAPTSAPAAAATPAAKPTAQSAASSGQRVSLQFWTNWSGNQKDAWNALNSEFQKQHSNIQIVSSFDALADLQQKVTTAIAGGAPPEMWINAAMVRPELIDGKAVVALESLGKVPDDFYKAADNASVRNGKRYGLPNNGGVPALWYQVNTAKAAGLDPSAPPQTWDDVLNWAKKMTVPAKKQFGIMLPTKPFPWTTECWYGFFLENGADLLNADRNQAAFNSPAGVEALDFWSKMVSTENVAPKQTLDDSTMMSTYQTGFIAMFPMYPVLTARIKSFPFPSLNVPYPKKVKQGAHFAGNYTTIAAAGKHQEDCFTWASWWWQPEINARWCSQTGGLPSRESSTKTATYQQHLKDEPLAKAFIDSLPFAQALPAVGPITEIEQAVSEAIEAACFGRATAKAALDAAADKANQAITKAQKS
jgi:multiple sugar transport system substrate-binding protein